MPAIHLRIDGKVQGVGFRWFVRDRAVALGLSGWVRNLPTGEVEVAATGEASVLAEFETAVALGPPGAIVRVVHRLRAPPEERYPHPFAIER